MRIIYSILLISIIYSVEAKAIECSDDELTRIKTEMKNLISEGGKCKEDSECINVHIGCPFGCGDVINSSSPQLDLINQKKTEWVNVCGTPCKYKCKSKYPTKLQCVEGQCKLVKTNKT